MRDHVPATRRCEPLRGRGTAHVPGTRALREPRDAVAAGSARGARRARDPVGDVRRRNAGRVRDDRGRGRGRRVPPAVPVEAPDRRDHQRKGNGTAALVFVSHFFRERGRNVMWTSAGEGDGGPIPFYERFGFVRTGEVHGEEAILRLEL